MSEVLFWIMDKFFDGEGCASSDLDAQKSEFSYVHGSGVSKHHFSITRGLRMCTIGDLTCKML